VARDTASQPDSHDQVSPVACGAVCNLAVQFISLSYAIAAQIHCSLKRRRVYLFATRLEKAEEKCWCLDARGLGVSVSG
jgi:hypothetical protein